MTLHLPPEGKVLRRSVEAAAQSRLSGSPKAAIPPLKNGHPRRDRKVQVARNRTSEQDGHSGTEPNRPFGDVVARANLELTKNAAEIGYARFLFTQRIR